MTDANFTRLFLRHDIEKIERQVAGRFVVVLQDGRIGIAQSIAEALARAEAPDAENVRRAA